MNWDALTAWTRSTIAAIPNWIDVQVVRFCTMHTSGSIAAMGCFKVATVTADRLVDSGWLALVHAIENTALIGILLWLVYQLGVLLWIHRVKQGGAGLVMVT